MQKGHGLPQPSKPLAIASWLAFQSRKRDLKLVQARVLYIYIPSNSLWKRENQRSRVLSACFGSQNVAQITSRKRDLNP